MRPRSVELMFFSFSMVEVSHASRPRQYCEPKRTTGKFLILRVWMRVSASKSSSIVPKPPGKMIYALLYLINIVLRTKKYLNDSDFVWYGLAVCSKGSSILQPTETLPA